MQGAAEFLRVMEQMICPQQLQTLCQRYAPRPRTQRKVSNEALVSSLIFHQPRLGGTLAQHGAGLHGIRMSDSAYSQRRQLLPVTAGGVIRADHEGGTEAAGGCGAPAGELLLRLPPGEGGWHAVEREQHALHRCSVTEGGEPAFVGSIREVASGEHRGIWTHESWGEKLYSLASSPENSGSSSPKDGTRLTPMPVRQSCPDVASGRVGCGTLSGDRVDLRCREQSL